MTDSPTIEDLLAEARHQRHRYDLYRAKMYKLAADDADAAQGARAGRPAPRHVFVESSSRARRTTATDRTR
jgi:hypothetical protein